MWKVFVLVIAWGMMSAGSVRGDTYSYYYYSLEWLVDASDSVVEATVVPGRYSGNPLESTATVKSVGRVLKQAGKVGPVAGTILPTHLAGGDQHRVLLFMRPSETRANEQVVYCIFLKADTSAEAKKNDAFQLLPYQSSSRLRISFWSPTCVAINRDGKVLTDPDAVVQLVEARIKADPKRVSSEGRFIKSGPKVDDGDDHNLLVPEVVKGK